MENNNPPPPPNENDLNDEFNKQFGNTNPPPQNFQQPAQQNFQQQGFQQTSGNFIQPLPPVPNATGALVLGIIGLVFAIIWCYWIAAAVGLILSIVALVMGNGAIRTFNENPTAYAENSLGNAKAGKILGLIGMIIAILWFLVIVIVLVFVGSLTRLF